MPGCTSVQIARSAVAKHQRVRASSPRARFRTRRLQKFIDLVATNHIRRFTQYSVENWSCSQGSNYQVVFDFFESGAHRN